MFQCHYEVLSVAQDADAATIKKAHRKLCLKFHPDKNLGDDESSEKFRQVQEAYECLSDVAERKWYDEHRDALLKGWSPNAGGGQNGDNGVDMLFDVIPFMHAHCYTGYEDNDEHSFYGIYGHVFASLAKEEADAVDGEKKDEFLLPFEFGNSKTNPKEIVNFYQLWEGFVSQQTFSWADQYDLKEADNRRVRRAMEDENKKARKLARKARNEDVLALVRFCKRRDPRMKALKVKQEKEKAAREQEQAESLKLKKQEKLEARDKWRQEAEKELAQAEEMDKLAGRVRLADLEDDYDYGGGKKKGKGKKKNRKNKQDEDEEEQTQEQGDSTEAATETKVNGETDNDNEATNGMEGDGTEGVADQQAQVDEPLDEYVEDPTPSQDNESASSEEEEIEPDVWRCECCRKDFKSEGQMDNHMKSKKHKEAYKKYQKKVEKELLEEMIDDMS